MNQGIPARNDLDDTRETLDAQATPAALRCTDAIMWQADEDHYPLCLVEDARAWLRGHRARTNHAVAFTNASFTVAGYLLGRRDAALVYGDTPPHDEDTAPSGALAWLCGAFSGAVMTLGLVILGHWLGALRGV